VIEAPLRDVSIGEMCVIRRGTGLRQIAGHAQVVGFSEEGAVLALLGPAQGLSRAVVIEPTGAPLKIKVSTDLLGTVVDAAGAFCARLVVDQTNDADRPDRRDGSFDDGRRLREIDATAIIEKYPVVEPFETGVRAIDGVLGAGIGQRVAVLASAGVGKTSLLHMIAAAASADVVVIGLVGERGREVSETIERIREAPRADRFVVLRATSDAPAVERAAAAASAMTIAEYFRDLGLHVVLILDSLTRYARALREIALSAGELPARQGYPASVFERLPRLLERAGRAGGGAITAFFSVLADDDDAFDPIAHEVISILDGHIVLSRQLAAEGCFPAIDILRSVSRVTARVWDAADMQRANAVRRVLARAAELAMLVDMGEYRAGAVPQDDHVLAAARRLREVLAQSQHESSSMTETRRAIDEALA
jgi:type III secretion protein N (ATPase)